MFLNECVRNIGLGYLFDHIDQEIKNMVAYSIDVVQCLNMSYYGIGVHLWISDVGNFDLYLWDQLKLVRFKELYIQISTFDN